MLSSTKIAELLKSGMLKWGSGSIVCSKLSVGFEIGISEKLDS